MQDNGYACEIIEGGTFKNDKNIEQAFKIRYKIILRW